MAVVKLNTKDNQSYKNTHIQIKDIFIKLLDQNEFDKITVKMICDTAGINCGSFYYHYHDIYEMLDEIENDLNRGLTEYAEEWTGKKEKNGKSPFIPYLKFIQKYSNVYRPALKLRRENPTENIFYPMWERIGIPICRRKAIEDEEELIYYYLAFQGALSLIFWKWLSSGCKMNIEKVSDILKNCLPFDL